MKRRELEEMKKAAYLSEADFTNAQDDDAALGGMYDDLYEEDLDEMIANLDEADEEESAEEILARITGTSVDPYQAEGLAEAEGDEEETDAAGTVSDGDGFGCALGSPFGVDRAALPQGRAEGWASADAAGNDAASLLPAELVCAERPDGRGDAV
jgi:hypothetical protein